MSTEQEENLQSNLVFIDLETTGLDKKTDAIIEVGIAIYSAEDGSPIFTRGWTIAPPPDFDYEQVNDVVLSMHLNNGLWDQLAEGIPYAMADDYLYNQLGGEEGILKEYNAENSPMCGNSVHFDRAFLEEQFPRTASLFDYHNIDVSTFTTVAKLFPGALDVAPKESNHRAVADCLLSIKQFNFYLGQFV